LKPAYINNLLNQTIREIASKYLNNNVNLLKFAQKSQAGIVNEYKHIYDQYQSLLPPQIADFKKIDAIDYTTASVILAVLNVIDSDKGNAAFFAVHIGMLALEKVLYDKCHECKARKSVCGDCPNKFGSSQCVDQCNIVDSLELISECTKFSHCDNLDFIKKIMKHRKSKLLDRDYNGIQQIHKKSKGTVQAILALSKETAKIKDGFRNRFSCN
jgi:hypothetical protein